MSRVRCLHGTQKNIRKWKLQIWLFEAHHLRIVSAEVYSERLLTEIHILESSSNLFWQDFGCAPAKFWLAKVKTFYPAKTGFCQIRQFWINVWGPLFSQIGTEDNYYIKFHLRRRAKAELLYFVIICVHYIAHKFFLKWSINWLKRRKEKS